MIDGKVIDETPLLKLTMTWPTAAVGIDVLERVASSCALNRV